MPGPEACYIDHWVFGPAGAGRWWMGFAVRAGGSWQGWRGGGGRARVVVVSCRGRVAPSSPLFLLSRPPQGRPGGVVPSRMPPGI